MFFKKKVKLDKILICIGNEEWTDENTYTIPYIDNLNFYFVTDEKGVFAHITKEDIARLGISGEELKNLGIENTRNRIFSTYKEIPVSYNEEDGVKLPFDADEVIVIGKENFWTSLILMPEFWDTNNDKCFFKDTKKYYISMPNKKFLIIGNPNNSNSMKEMKNIMDEYFDNINEYIDQGDTEWKRTISKKIYLLSDNKLSIIDNNCSKNT